MELDEEYPKTCRKRTSRIVALLESVGARRREDVAMAMNQLADKARDLDEIMDRLLNETHTPAQIGELLIAFELVTEQLRGHSDTIDGKLYEIADRLKEARKTNGLRRGKSRAKA